MYFYKSFSQILGTKSRKVGMTFILTCAPPQIAEPPPPSLDSVSVPSALGAFSLSGRLLGSSVCEPGAHPTVLCTPCQTGQLCFLHYWHYGCSLHHHCAPPRQTKPRWVQIPASSGRSWWWSRMGKQVHLERGKDPGRLDKGKFGDQIQSCTWNWELLQRRMKLKSSGADSGGAGSDVQTEEKVLTWSSPGRSNHSPLVPFAQCSQCGHLKYSHGTNYLTNFVWKNLNHKHFF